MKRLILVVAIIGLVGATGFIIVNSQDDSDSRQEPVSTSSAPDETQPAEQEAQEPTGAESESVDRVEISQMAFQQDNITVKAGTTVTWTNQDVVEHDVAPDQESDAFQGSELLAQGESYSFTFDTPGTYTYHCSPHPHMTGTVVVTD